jgi:hypothetical protein
MGPAGDDERFIDRFGWGEFFRPLVPLPAKAALHIVLRAMGLRRSFSL